MLGGGVRGEVAQTMYTHVSKCKNNKGEKKKKMACFRMAGMAQVVEHLFCKPEAMNSNPSPTKNKGKKRSIFY
jgi:hypothetical protein